MTKTQLMQLIHRIYTQDTDYVDSSSDDYEFRETWADMAVDTWAKDSGIAWRELTKTHSFTTVDADGDYALPSDFSYPIGYLRIFDSGDNPALWPYVKTEVAHITEYTDPSSKRYYIDGTQGAYILNMRPTPTTANGLAGLTGKLDYYAEPVAVSAMGDSDLLPMSDPYYVVHFTVANLFSIDEDNANASKHFQIADQKLGAMRTKNTATPFGHVNQMTDFSVGFGL